VLIVLVVLTVLIVLQLRVVVKGIAVRICLPVQLVLIVSHSVWINLKQNFLEKPTVEGPQKRPATVKLRALPGCKPDDSTRTMHVMKQTNCSDQAVPYRNTILKGKRSRTCIHFAVNLQSASTAQMGRNRGLRSARKPLNHKHFANHCGARALGALQPAGLARQHNKREIT
jgi:hypothetical protein